MLTKAQPGLIGIVGDEYKKDFWAAARRIAEIGYRGIEGCEQYLLDGNPPDNLRRLHDLGLRILTITGSREHLRDDLPRLIAKAKAVGADRVSCWWAPCDTREAVLQDADLFNRAGKALADEGIRLCYHHHDHEFRNVFNGISAFDTLADHTDPAACWLYVDIAWAAFAGVDPVALIRRLNTRIPALHVKDLHTLAERGRFTTVCTGVVDVVGSVRAAIECGIEWAVVEQDKLRNLSPWETVTASYLNLKETDLIE